MQHDGSQHHPLDRGLNRTARQRAILLRHTYGLVTHNPRIRIARERISGAARAFGRTGSSSTLRGGHTVVATKKCPLNCNEILTPQNWNCGPWKSGNPQTGFPLSHRPDSLRQQGKDLFMDLIALPPRGGHPGRRCGVVGVSSGGWSRPGAARPGRERNQGASPSGGDAGPRARRGVLR